MPAQTQSQQAQDKLLLLPKRQCWGSFWAKMSTWQHPWLATKRTSSLSSKACEQISNIPWGQVTCNVQGWVPSRNPSSQNYYRRTSDFMGKPYGEGWVLTGGRFLLLSKRNVSSFGSYHKLSTLMAISQLNITQTDCLLCPVVSCGPKKPLSHWLVPWWPTLCRKPVWREGMVLLNMWDLQECEVEAPAH